MDWRKKEGRSRRLAYTLLIAAGLFLAARMGGTDREIRLARDSVVKRSGATDPARGHLVHRFYEAIGIFAERSVSNARDPFRQPVSTRRPPSPQIAAVVVPTLNSVLTDRAEPVCQLSMEGDVSGWLRVGEVFHGWRVVEIRPGSAMVSQNDETRQLTL